MPNSEKNLRRIFFSEHDRFKNIKTEAYVVWNALVAYPVAMTNRKMKEGILGAHSSRV